MEGKNIQLQLDILPERNKKDRYSEMKAEYEKHIHFKGIIERDIYFCFCFRTGQYFVSRYFKKESIINWYKEKIKIIQ